MGLKDTNEKRLSWHFLRRRAEARARQIRSWQDDARPRGPAFGGANQPPTLTKAAAIRRLEALGINFGTPILVFKRGKWDARYDVVAVVDE